MHPPSIHPVLRSPREAGSGQGIPRHTGGSAYRCSLPGLAGLADSRCVRPSLHRLSARLSPTRGHLGREFDPARADCGYRAPLPPRLARSHRNTVRALTEGRRRSAGAPEDDKWRRGRDLNPRHTFWACTRFPVVPLRPLGHLSPARVAHANPRSRGMAEGVGFEPTWGLITPNSISSRARYDHFGTPPRVVSGRTPAAARRPPRPARRPSPAPRGSSDPHPAAARR